MTKVIAYARISTGHQDLQRQIMLVKDFCLGKGYKYVDAIVEQESGTKRERKGMKQLLSLTKEDCDLVVVTELSRIQREEEFQRIFAKIDTLRDNGISVMFLDDPDTIYSKEKPISLTQFIMLGVRAQGARDELLKIRDRMKSGRVAKLRTNPYMVTGSQIPFGYEKYSNPDYELGKTPKSLIRINEKEASVIRFCYDMACNGKSCQKIADYLNTTGNIHRNNKGEKLWQATEVTRMLRNRLYIGERTIEGVTHKVTPIVSKEVFKLASECISKNRCIIAKESRFNPLKGLFFCGDCGLPMSVTMNSAGKLVYRCLYATYHKKNPNRQYEKCNNNYVYYDALIESVWLISRILMAKDEYYTKSQLAITDCEKQLQEVEEKIKINRKERAEAKRGMNVIIKNLKNITDKDIADILQEKYRSLQTKNLEKEKELGQLNDMKNMIHKKIEDLELETFPEWNQQEVDIYKKAEFFNRVLEKVEWFGEKFQRKGTLQITYKNGQDSTCLGVSNKELLLKDKPELYYL